jgi:hypothetical protein
VEQCGTEFYKPLDYDDQLLPEYLERAVATLDARRADVYGCLLTTLQDGQFSPRWWPNKPLETMFTGNSDDNQLPHSSVLMRTDACRAAGNYNERAVGLGADDYNLWYRLHKVGAKFVRDDAVRNVVYRIHDKNSLKIRKARYGKPGQGHVGRIAGAAAAASIALFAAPHANAGEAAPPAGKAQVTQPEAPKKKKDSAPADLGVGPVLPDDLLPPQS